MECFTIRMEETKGVDSVLIQLVIVTVLLFVLFFGLGFILNMLIKTTWLPIYMYFLLVGGMIVYWGVKSGFAAAFEDITFVDLVPAAGGLVGAVLSGKAIKTLRIKGYKMF